MLGNDNFLMVNELHDEAEGCVNQNYNSNESDGMDQYNKIDM